MDKAVKSRETQLRRVALRRGYRIAKSRVRDPMALAYGKYIVTPAKGGDAVELPSLDAVEEYLNRGQRHG